MWELDTGLEPYQGQNYHALLLRLANPREQLRPPLPGGPDWEGEACLGCLPCPSLRPVLGAAASLGGPALRLPSKEVVRCQVAGRGSV